MRATIKEFWLKWRLRVAEERVLANTRTRKSLVLEHQRQVAKTELIKTKLEAAS
jgi:hypothetical protein